MARYRDRDTGKYISIGKARRLGKVIYKVDDSGRERVSKNFRPPPQYSGLKIRDIKTGKYTDEKQAAGKWVQLEKWENGKRKEIGKINRYSKKDIDKIKNRLSGGAGAQNLGLIQAQEKIKKKWGQWGNTSEKAYTISKATDVIIATFRENLNQKKQKQFDENKDLIDDLVLKYISENTTEADIEDMSFEEYENFINEYLNEIGDNLDDLEMFSIPF